jgi:hypothetical protein
MAVLSRSQGPLGRARGIRELRCVAAVALTFLVLLSAHGASRDRAEYQVKAAFILNFARFVDWPASAFASSNSPLVVGVLGQDPFEGALKTTLSGKTVEAHPLVVKQVSRPEEVLQCHILFISESEKPRLEKIFKDVSRHPILTVSDIDDFTDAGGIIWLKRRQDMIRFEINRTAAEATGLKISARLFKLADNSRDK